MKKLKKAIWIIACLASLSVNAQFTSKLPEVQQTSFRKDTLNIASKGAKPDGYTLNTKIINDAIAAQSNKGGGVVLIPQGLWLTGPVVLKNNVNLHVATGGTLLFTDDFDQYPLVKGNWEGLPQWRNQSPISAEGAVNIAITGRGIIDGNGGAWRAVKKDKLTENQWRKLVASGGITSDDKKTWYPTEKNKRGNQSPPNPGMISPDRTPAFYDSIKDFLRPNLVVFTNCKKILLEGVTFQNSPAWCLHPLMSEHITVRNIFVKNPWFAQNGDGIDLESCKNVLIENSVFDVGDDALCMKSGRDAAGRARGMATQDVIIRGCTVYAAHGGFVIGSEMSGGAKNMFISNCTFLGTDIGLRFKTTRGRGGVVENIHIQDIYMKDIPGEAILFDMYYMAKDPVPLAGEKRELPRAEFKPVDETTPVFRNFNIKNVYVNGAEKAVFIRGLPEMHVRNIVLENLFLQAKKGIDIQEASGITLRNITGLFKETNPSIDITQSDNIVFDKIELGKNRTDVIRLNGDRINNITFKKASFPSSAITYELGATQKSVTIQ